MEIFKPTIQDQATFSGSVDISGSLTITQNLNVVGELQGAAATASYISLANVDGFTDVSSSIEQRISRQELFSGSLDSTFATDQQVSDAVSSLNAATSSYALQADISGSFTSVSQSLAGRITPLEGSVSSLNAATSSYALQADISGSFTSVSESLAGRITPLEGSVSALNLASSSYLLNTTDTLDGDLTVTGKITAQEFHTEFVSASIIYQSGSTQFGNSADDTHTFTGNIGIGTTTPYDRLELYEPTANGINIKLSNNGGSKFGILGLDSSGKLKLHSNDEFIITGGLYFFDRFKVDSTGQIIIGGNVGIGTATPSQKLHVVGDAIFSSYVGFNGITSPEFPVDISAVDGGKILRSTRGTSVFRIDQSSDGPGYIGMESNDDLSIQTNNTSKIYIKADGNVGIGTTSPVTKLHVEGSVYIPSSGTLTGDAGTIAGYDIVTGIYTYAGGQLIITPDLGLMEFNNGSSNTMVIDHVNSTVGIGLPGTGQSLLYPLEVGGMAAASSLLINPPEDVTAADSTILIGGAYAASMYTNGNGFNIGVALSPPSPSGQNSPNIVIKGDGNVGIGITNPAQKLHIHDGATTNLKITSTSSGTGALDGLNLAIGNGFSQLWYYENGYFRIATNSAERLRIDSSGNVGIGTTSPSGKLHVYGGRIVLDNTLANQSAFQFNHAGTEMGVLYRPAGSSTELRLFMTGYGDLMRWKNNGTVGIGKDPSYALDVNGTGRFGAECLIGTNISAGYYQDVSNGAYRANGTTGNRGYYFQSFGGGNTTMYVGLVGTYAGRVGIGTTSPNSKLDVNGQINIQGSYYSIDGLSVAALGTPFGYEYAGGNLIVDPVTLTFQFDSQDILYGTVTQGYVPAKATFGVADSPISTDFSGNVGINLPGIGLPQANLHVNGTSLIGNGTSTRAGLGLTLAASGTDIYSANTDIQDINRQFTIINDSNIVGNYAALSFRVLPSTGTAMADIKLVRASSSGDSTLYTTVRDNGGTFRDVLKTTSTSFTVQGSTAGATVLDIQGTSGQLFSVTDDLTGTLFSVSDISGIPILEVDATGTVTIESVAINVTSDSLQFTPPSTSIFKYAFNNASPGGSAGNIILNTASSFIEGDYQIGLVGDFSTIIRAGSPIGTIYLDPGVSGGSYGSVECYGNLNVAGTKNFRIDHPVKPETHDLIHTVIESNRGDVLYRGKANLVDGTASINLDQYNRTTEGTFEALTKDVQVFTTNEDGWTQVKGSVTGNILNIIAQDSTCTDEISWLVIGERNDPQYLNSGAVDENGRLILEPEESRTFEQRTSRD